MRFFDRVDHDNRKAGVFMLWHTRWAPLRGDVMSTTRVVERKMTAFLGYCTIGYRKINAQLTKYTRPQIASGSR